MDAGARERLVALLREASAEMMGYGEAFTPSSYDTCAKLGGFLAEAAGRLAEGDESDLSELWGVFVPTSDWDDSGGSAALGNEVFALLKR